MRRKAGGAPSASFFIHESLGATHSPSPCWGVFQMVAIGGGGQSLPPPSSRGASRTAATGATAGLATAKLLPGAHIVRAFNAIGAGSLATDAHRPGEPVGVPIAGDDPKAIALATSLIKETGFEPVLIGGLAKGKYLVPGTPLSGEHTPAEIRKIAASLA